ncbi:MAG: hypothetical protein Q4C54_08975 [Clostridia bacterium]|nr:hypothetical protein [Clostridia bacterium]
MFKRITALMALLAALSLCSCALAQPLVRAGGSFGIAVDAKGNIWGWGDNANGQLGNGNNKRVYMPKPAAEGLDGAQVADVQCGNVSALFLMKDGTVYTCGYNNYGQQGIPGIGSHVFVPTKIPGLENIVQVACGFGQCLARTADGKVYAWGRNSNGQVGDGTRKNAAAPVLLALENIVDIQCGGKFCVAQDANGDLWGWGDNEYGQLTDASRYKNVLIPVRLSVSGRFTKLACGGDIAFGVDADGVLWAWGRNDYYQLGVKSVGEKTNTPVKVDLPDGLAIKKVYAYNSHTAALTEDGGLWTWGGVYHGQVGNGKRPWRDIAHEACPESGVVDAAVGSLQSYILTEDGTVFGNGCNEYGQVGAFPKMRYYVPLWMNTGLNLNDGTWADPKNP